MTQANKKMTDDFPIQAEHFLQELIAKETEYRCGEFYKIDLADLYDSALQEWEPGMVAYCTGGYPLVFSFKNSKSGVLKGPLI